jgi:hypothetical protein
MDQSNDDRRSVSAVGELARARALFSAGAPEAVEEGLAALEEVKLALEGRTMDEASRRELEGIQALVTHGTKYWTELAARLGHETDASVLRSWEG